MKRRSFLASLAALPFVGKRLLQSDAPKPVKPEVVAGNGLIHSGNNIEAVEGQFWYRSDLSNGRGSGAIFYRDNSGNTLRVG